MGALPLLDGDVIDGDVSLDAGASDALDHHLTGSHISSARSCDQSADPSADDQSTALSVRVVVRVYLEGCAWLDVDLGLLPLVSLVTAQAPDGRVRQRRTFLSQKDVESACRQRRCWWKLRVVLASSRRPVGASYRCVCRTCGSRRRSSRRGCC